MVSASSSDVFGSVHDFFASSAWLLARNLGALVLALLWLGTLAWTLKDARRRIADPVLVAVALVVGAVPVVGTLVYLLVRPPEYLDDVAERRLEIEALEEELAAASPECPACRGAVRADFLVCPVCATRLKEACAGCGAPLDAAWQACPLCATPRAAGPARALDAYLLEVARDVAPEPEPEPAPEAAPATEPVR